ncbi:MAG: efflux RND transporter periplasmic adaptor subunit [Pirellulales bacterium]|nr:efflux RND transporter periplasmic adaptor subunit [Pirellulales bacterium]
MSYRIIFLAPCCLTFLLAAGCQRSTPQPAQQAGSASATKVEVGVVREQTLKNIINLPATIESDESAMLMPRVEAYVDQVLVDIGDEVQAGQVLVRLSAPELLQEAQQQRAMIQQLMADGQVMRAELESARTQLKVGHAELNLKNSERQRLAKLVRTGAIGRQRLEEAESAAQSTQAMLQKYRQAVRVVEAKLKKGEAELAVGQTKLQRAETLASYLEIKAPFAGVVAQRSVDPGNLVRPSNQGSDVPPLLTLAKVARLRAVFHATTDVAGQLAVGCTTSFISDDLPGRLFEGRLSRLAGTYNEKTRMMRAEMDLDNPLDPATSKRPLRAGSYGSVKIVLQSTTLPVVPTSALRKQGARHTVIVVSNGTCIVTPVETALIVDGLAAIAQGISVGNQVVLKNVASIEDGQVLKGSEIEVVLW